MFAYCAAEVPRWNTISISGYHMREAGATAPQELAFTLANGIAYVQAAVDAGLNVDDFAGRLSFFFASHNNLFEEAAKFRAARRMWAGIMRHRFGAKDPRSWMLRFHTQTAGVTLQAQQPDVNVVRTTVQALAAVLGGTQSLHVNSKDEALGLPTEDSAALALRTQQVLANESGVAETIDPLGGSYYVERLTDAIEREAAAYIERIDAMGGAVAAIEAGFQRGEIEEAAYRHFQLVESGERVIVGVNAFTSEEDERIELQTIPPHAAQRQLDRLVRVRNERDTATRARRLCNGSARPRAPPSVNLMPPILECVESYATLGEICSTLRDVFGTFEAARLEGAPSPSACYNPANLLCIGRMKRCSPYRTTNASRRSGPGTPMGELMRRYWHPFAAATELDERPTKPVRLLGEDLVLYKDRVGHARPHRTLLPSPPCRPLLRHSRGAWPPVHVPRLDDGRDRPVHRAALRRDGAPGRTLQGEGEDRGVPRSGDGGDALGVHGPRSLRRSSPRGSPTPTRTATRTSA